ncbi:class I SAM-dependent methyltransferase [Aquipuribacter nitratireducens]|uniref:Class I SAM-dependent methyltransferase n=1 Tax=Aquipuribacter nitratireducens TaxID=650104 RepID=A0ABW0GKV7_9MICO
METDSGPLRAGYLAVATGARRALDGTALLRRWDARAAAAPRSRTAHLRTLLAVHNAEDLVALDLPWWTYEAVDAVDDFLRTREAPRAFEYGSGASTVWLARRCDAVDAVEHQAGWAERVRQLLAEAPGLRCTPVLHVPEIPAVPSGRTARTPSRAPSGTGLDFDGYVRTVDAVEGTVDLLCVDGRAREAALLHALDRVADDGLVLLDDAQRERYHAPVASAVERGWYARRTRGATPCQPLPRETVLLSRDRDVLEVLGRRPAPLTG